MINVYFVMCFCDVLFVQVLLFWRDTYQINGYVNTFYKTAMSGCFENLAELLYNPLLLSDN